MKNIILAILPFLLWQCEIKPEEIQYAKDPCQFCKMTIMEPGFAAELVTKKGKSFKFDDLSCMIQYMKTEGNTYEDYELVLVNDHSDYTFIDADKARFIRDERLQSPMRGDLGAFGEKIDKEFADSKVLSWSEVWNLF